MDVSMSSPSRPENLVVMYKSSRARPLSRIALPASSSFLYACAVSYRDRQRGVKPCGVLSTE